MAKAAKRARKTAGEKDKKATGTKGPQVAKPARTKVQLPPAPAAPGTAKGEKKKRVGPQADLQRAENALDRAIEAYAEQYAHPSNEFVDFRELYARAEKLQGVYRKKAFSKSSRDLSYDWVDFAKQAKQLEEDILQVVIDDLKERADAMVWTGSLDPNNAEDKAAAQEAYEEADDFPHLRGKIFGWSRLVNKKLPALGCSNPDDEPRGGRQQGGKRGGRRSAPTKLLQRETTRVVSLSGGFLILKITY